MRSCLITAATLLPLLIAPASGTVLISGDNGGKMEDYTSRYRQVSSSGEAVVIDGTCLSACTMVLGLVPRHRICTTTNAVLGFHAAWEYDRSGARIASPSGTRDLLRSYPSVVRAWIARHGGLTPNMMYLRGRDLAAIVPTCDAASRTAAGPMMRRVRGLSEIASRAGRRASVNAR